MYFKNIFKINKLATLFYASFRHTNFKSELYRKTTFLFILSCGHIYYPSILNTNFTNSHEFLRLKFVKLIPQTNSCEFVKFVFTFFTCVHTIVFIKKPLKIKLTSFLGFLTQQKSIRFTKNNFIFYEKKILPYFICYNKYANN
jgi:hypothetical protein